MALARLARAAPQRRGAALPSDARRSVDERAQRSKQRRALLSASGLEDKP
jgi:hypothetical protein